MTLSRLATDSTTEARLGPALLTELRATLWAVDCQTCGGRFGRWEKPSLTVQAVADAADASLHHHKCRSPRWLEGPTGDDSEVTAFPHVTWRAGLILLSPSNTPVFLVNPTYELATLRRDDGRWRLATLDPFAAYGMGTDLFDGVTAQPSLSVVVDRERITAQITNDGAVAHSWHVAPLSPGMREAVDAREWLTVGVTTSLDVGRRMPGNPLPKLIEARQVRLGAARIAYTEPAQPLSETDFARKVRLEMIALMAEMLKRQTGVEINDALLTATLECSTGNNAPITLLEGRDKPAAALPVVMLYATKARTASRRPAHGGGVHIMTASETGASPWSEMLTAVAELTGTTVATLATDPTVEQRRTEYLADVVIGTPEQFRAAYAFYRDDDGDWSLHETRGQVAMTVGFDVRNRAAELLRRYPRVAVI